MMLYQSSRKMPATRGLEVIMVEHRGVGHWRADIEGELLTESDVTVEAAADGLAAVLDTLAVDKAVVAGSSYGSYLAQVFAVSHPIRWSLWYWTRPCCRLKVTRRWCGLIAARCCGMGEQRIRRGRRRWPG